MNRTFRHALGAKMLGATMLRATVLGATAMIGTLALVAAPAASAAKKEAVATPGAVDAKNISKAVRPFIVEAQKLDTAGDSAGALAQLRAAEATGSLNSTDVFFISQMKLGVANKLKDDKTLEEAIAASASSEFLPAAEKPKYLRNLAALALKRNDYINATKRYEELAAMNPNDAEVIVNLAELYQRQKQGPKAVETLAKAIDASKASGTPAPEAWYRRRLAIAYDGKLADQIQPASMALVLAYPTPVNWRDALIILRDSSKLDDQGNLDVLRLMSAADALTGERDFAEYAETASMKGLPGEAKAVLTAGKAKGALSATKPLVVELSKNADSKVASDRAALPGLDKEARAAATGKAALATADAYYGYGDYAKAADLYKVAVTKGGVDADTANLRLGASMARGGDKAGAAAAFGAVKGPGPRASLAQYWLTWMEQKKA